MLPAPFLISLGKFTVNIFLEHCQALTEPECMPNCEIEPEKQVVRNLFLSNPQGFVKNKNKNKTSGGSRERPGWPLVVGAHAIYSRRRATLGSSTWRLHYSAAANHAGCRARDAFLHEGHAQPFPRC